MLCIKYIAFACYPPWSETSHDGRLVDQSLSHISHMYSFLIVDCQIFYQGVALKESRDLMIYVVYVVVSTGM